MLLLRFSINFWNFNYNVSQHGSLWIHLIVLCGPPESGSLILSQVWEVFSHYFIEKPFCPFSSLPSGTCIINILILLMATHSVSYLNSFAFFSCCSWLVKFHCLITESAAPFPPLHLVCRWTPLVNFSVPFLCSLALWFDWYFVTFSFCWNSLTLFSWPCEHL